MSIIWPKGFRDVVKALAGYGATPLVAIALAFLAFSALLLQAPALPVLGLTTILIVVVAIAEDRRQRHRIEEKQLDFDLLQQTKYPEISEELKRHTASSQSKNAASVPQESN
jgi:hypothetical protein